MRQIVLILLCVLSIATASAQNSATGSMSIDVAFNACIAMRDAVAATDTAAIRQSACDLKAAGTTHFSSLRCKDDSIVSLRGHLVFDV